MEPISIRRLAAALGKSVDSDAPITHITTDSRDITPGCLFVCIEGERFDGHDFAPAAARAGAAWVVARKQVPLPPQRVLYVEDTLDANILLAGAYRSMFTVRGVGITGSVGKTTTKELVAAALSQKYRTLKNEGNQNNEIGVPATLRRLTRDTQAMAIEMGMNKLGDIEKLTRAVLPQVGIITNIGTSHIELLGSRENILRAKLEITAGMAPGAPLVLCADNDLLSGVCPQGLRPVWYGIESPLSQVRAANIREREGQTFFDILYEGSRYAALLPTIGRHHVLDALAAFAAGAELGVPPAAICAALAAYAPTGMRQRLVEKGGVAVVEDCYNASPDSMRAALSAFAAMEVKGRRIAVLGDMLELGATATAAHRQVGAAWAAAGVDVLLCTGSHAGDYRAGAAGEGLAAEVFGNKEALADRLINLVSPGDAVWFKASRGVKLEEAIARLYAGLGGDAGQ